MDVAKPSVAGVVGGSRACDRKRWRGRKTPDGEADEGSKKKANELGDM